MKKYFYILAFATVSSVTAQKTQIDSTWTSSRPDGHAPISIMGDHTHNKGEFMFSYRFMLMNMEELNRGSQSVPYSNAILPNGNYMVTPTKMPMSMHMVGAMYAPSARITLSIMANFIQINMEHLTAMGGTFETEASGLGDTQIGALYKFFNANHQQLHGQIGVSLPTGSIENTDITPASSPNKTLLPYPMQIGSGTWDALVALTYLKQWQTISYGAQAKTVIRTGKNSNDYRLGNSYSIHNWLAFTATSWLSFSVRFELGVLDKIKGINKQLNPMMVITADTQNSGMTYGNLGFGFNLYSFKGSLKNMRLGFETSMPVFQNKNGVQLRNQETFSIGLQYAL
ncbi:transporter [Aquimarina sp. W85]|uniref:transporter n=1 Tax=Aquimarina rhodophyticola TaxID=3342246 RepID=UPI003672A13F